MFLFQVIYYLESKNNVQQMCVEDLNYVDGV